MTDFINSADMGKLLQACNELSHYEKLRNENLKIRFEEVPPEACSLQHSLLEPNRDLMELFAKDNGIPEVTLNVANRMVYKAALEHEDIKEDLKSMLTKIILYYSVQMQPQKDLLVKANVAKNERRAGVIASNEEKARRSEQATTAYKKKIVDSKELLNIRKQKMIRTINKALSLVGSPNEMTGTDRKTFRYFTKIGLVGHDGSVFCCVEQTLMDMDAAGTRQVMLTVLDILKRVTENN